MNQRRRNRSRHAAMPHDQLVERINGRRIAQHHGDLPTTRNAGGLALGAGLGLHSVRRCGREDFAAVCGEHFVRLGLADVERPAVGRDIAPAGRCFLSYASSDRSWQAGGVELWANVHDLLRSGSIPPMSESYAVTSDVSTGIAR